MSKETRAILLIYTGDQISQETIETIAAVIGAQCDTERIDNFVYSAEEIAAAIMQGKRADVATVKPKTQQLTPEDEAVVFIGNVMKDALEAPFDGYNLFKELMLKIDELRNSENTEMRKQFMNALFILSQENLVISKSLMKKYHFSQEKLMTIKKTYNFVTKF